ncbi:uncharacterized protein I206_105906 [Kwoniella pini CBS 10737]|uniref:Uncharacterized protein n=1 Tax=Kwoniella pini CBS 10737 TaxID=1296096 RepID=A0A1B9I0I2_9TREE|nr:uncharacterized protein I206_04729 [Kwoniella pini CBS 10737]OCF49042.1 hypothetical protein I206_04729 [Kwoniella pini CBS 10737]
MLCLGLFLPLYFPGVFAGMYFVYKRPFFLWPPDPPSPTPFPSPSNDPIANAESQSYAAMASCAVKLGPRRRNGNGVKASQEVPRPAPVPYVPNPGEHILRTPTTNDVPPVPPSPEQTTLPRTDYVPPDPPSLERTLLPSSPQPTPPEGSPVSNTPETAPISLSSEQRMLSSPHGPSPLGPGSRPQTRHQELTPPSQISSRVPDPPTSDPASLSRSLSYTSGHEDVLQTPYHSSENHKVQGGLPAGSPPPAYSHPNINQSPSVADQPYYTLPQRSRRVKPTDQQLRFASRDDIELLTFPIPHPAPAPRSASSTQTGLQPSPLPRDVVTSDPDLSFSRSPSFNSLQPPAPVPSNLSPPMPSRHPLAPLPSSMPFGPAAPAPVPEKRGPAIPEAKERSPQSASRPHWSQEQYLKEYDEEQARRARAIEALSVTNAQANEEHQATGHPEAREEKSQNKGKMTGTKRKR